MNKNVGTCISLSILFFSCMTNSEKKYSIDPDLSLNNSWTYQFRQYSRNEDGSFSDTLKYFIYYKIENDSMISGEKYRILSEEDLVIVNSALTKTKSFHAIKKEPGRILVKQLAGQGQSLGRYPFKSSAANAFDTTHFFDEATALEIPLTNNQSWYYRLPDHPLHHGPVKKMFLGEEVIENDGEKIKALKFEFIIEDMLWLKSFEWYSGNIKIKTVSFLKSNDTNNDSSFTEMEYIGQRAATNIDSQMVMDSYEKWSH